jgi:hypothetical protein
MRNNQWGVSMKICIDLGGGAGTSDTDAKMLLYFMIGIMILCGVLFLICDVIPWILQFVHSTMCTFSPNWKMASDCL